MSENIKLMTNEEQSKKGRIKEGEREGGREGGRGREERVLTLLALFYYYSNKLFRN